VVTLARVGNQPRGGSWGSDGTIVVAPVARGGLARVAAAGGPLVPLTDRDPERPESHRWPQVLPDGPWVLFTVSSARNTFYDDLEAVSLVTGERRPVLRDGYHGRYAAGRLFFTRRGQELAVPFDPRRLAVAGAPVQVLEELRHDQARAVAHFAVAEDGTLVHGPANPPLASHLAWVEADGTLTRLAGPGPFREPRLGPDQRQVAVCVGDFESAQLWVLDTETKKLARRGPAVANCHRPTWTPDGRGITLASYNRRGRWAIVTVPAGDPGPGRLHYEGERPIYPSAWTRDGRLLIVEEHRSETNWDLRVLEVAAGGRAVGEMRDLAALPGPEQNAALSPDGRWVAYEAGQPGSIHVAPFMREGRTIQVTRRRAECPRWGPGGELYFWVPGLEGTGPGAPLEGLLTLPWPPAAMAPLQPGPVWPKRGADPGLDRSRANGVPESCNQRFDVSAGPNRRFLVLDAVAEEGAGWWRPPVVTPRWVDGLPVVDGRRP
jgi:hypothetical protein